MLQRASGQQARRDGGERQAYAMAGEVGQGGEMFFVSRRAALRFSRRVAYLLTTDYYFNFYTATPSRRR